MDLGNVKGKEDHESKKKSWNNSERNWQKQEVHILWWEDGRETKLSLSFKGLMNKLPFSWSQWKKYRWWGLPVERKNGKEGLVGDLSPSWEGKKSENLSDGGQRQC